MKRSRFTEEQIKAILREHQSGITVTELRQRHGISSATFYAWKTKFGILIAPDLKCLKTLTEENTRLKKLLADVVLDNAMLRELLSKK